MRWLVATTLVMACGGRTAEIDGLGIDPSKAMSDLSQDEIGHLCVWSVQKRGGAGNTTYCGAGRSISVGGQDQCIREVRGVYSWSLCGAVVGTWADCMLEEARAPCDEPLGACGEIERRCR